MCRNPLAHSLRFLSTTTLDSIFASRSQSNPLDIFCVLFVAASRFVASCEGPILTFLLSVSVAGACAPNYEDLGGSCVQCDAPNAWLTAVFFLVYLILIFLFHRMAQTPPGELSESAEN